MSGDMDVGGDLKRISAAEWETGPNPGWFKLPGPFPAGRHVLSLVGAQWVAGDPCPIELQLRGGETQSTSGERLLFAALPSDKPPRTLHLDFDLVAPQSELHLCIAGPSSRFRLQTCRVAPEGQWRRRWRVASRLGQFLARSPAGLLSDVERYLGKRALLARSSQGRVTAPSESPQLTPLNLRVGLDPRTTLNVLLPGLTLRTLSGGPNTALNLGYRLAEAGLRVRFVATDLPLEQNVDALWSHVQKLTDIPRRLENVSWVSAADRGRPLDIGERDVFLATAWWTAHFAAQARRQVSCPRFIYLIQDYEPGLYPWSTSAALAEETYGFDYDPLICSGLLADYFLALQPGRFADPAFRTRCRAFEPAVDPSRFKWDRRDTSPRKRLVFYARPQAPRNLYELGLTALRRAVDRGAFRNWELWFMGEDLPAVDLGRGVVIRPFAWAGYDEYAELLRGTDVGLSLMLSPHTSYPPLELAACGATVVTNTFSIKTAERLQRLSSNCWPVAPTIEAVTEGLLQAAVRADHWSARQAGASVSVPPTWKDSFVDVIPWIIERCEQARRSSPGALTSVA